MKKRMGLLIMGLFGITVLLAQEKKGEMNCENSKTGDLKITFVLNETKGTIFVAVYESENDFLEKASKKIKIDCKDGKNKTYSIKGLCLNKYYAIAAFLDENGNEKLDKNFLGIPKEIYGFSNNSKDSFGPPEFKEVKFNMDAKEKTINIKLD